MQYIEAIDEKIKVYMEVDELLQQAVTEERFGDAARLRRQVAARQPERPAPAITKVSTCRLACCLTFSSCAAAWEVVDWVYNATAGGGADEAGRSVCCHGGADAGPGGGAVRSEVVAPDTC